jgi:U3 small nucleolar RNA-associated protein 23
MLLFCLVDQKKVPGVPLIFGLRNALFLESPSASQKEHVKTSEERRLHMTDIEYQIFKDRAMKRLADGCNGSSIKILSSSFK